MSWPFGERGGPTLLAEAVRALRESNAIVASLEIPIFENVGRVGYDCPRAPAVNWRMGHS